MKLTTTKTPDGAWRVKGVPLTIWRDAEPPRYGERAEWFVSHEGAPHDYLLRGFYSKASALEALERLGDIFAAAGEPGPVHLLRGNGKTQCGLGPAPDRPVTMALRDVTCPACAAQFSAAIEAAAATL